MNLFGSQALKFKSYYLFSPTKTEGGILFLVPIPSRLHWHQCRRDDVLYARYFMNYNGQIGTKHALINTAFGHDEDD